MPVTTGNKRSKSCMHHYTQPIVNRTVYLRFKYCLFFYYPATQGMLICIKADAYLHNGQSAEHKAFGIILQIYLSHGGIGTLAQFQFDDIQGIGSMHHHIHTSFGGMDFRGSSPLLFSQKSVCLSGIFSVAAVP